MDSKQDNSVPINPPPKVVIDFIDRSLIEHFYPCHYLADSKGEERTRRLNAMVSGECYRDYAKMMKDWETEENKKDCARVIAKIKEINTRRKQEPDVVIDWFEPDLSEVPDEHIGVKHKDFNESRMKERLVSPWISESHQMNPVPEIEIKLKERLDANNNELDTPSEKYWHVSLEDLKYSENSNMCDRCTQKNNILMYLESGQSIVGKRDACDALEDVCKEPCLCEIEQ